MAIERINGIDMYHEVHGDGFPIVLTHGYGSTSQAWLPQVEPLSQRYRLITWDARGHGRTESPEQPSEYSDDATVADIAALLDHVGVDRAVIGGLSMGGYMTMQFALRHPERAAALIICDTGPGTRNPATRAAWNQNARDRAAALRRIGIDALSTSPEVDLVRRDHLSVEGLAKAALGMVLQDHEGVLGQLHRIVAPTLVIVGELDEPFLNGIDYIASHIAGAEKVVIPDAGHSSNIDNPDAFNAAVLGFLDRLDLPPS